MEFIDAILPEFYRTAIGWTILHSIWQIVAISLLLYMAIRIWDRKSASFKYKISYASLLLIFFVSILTFTLSLSDAKPAGKATGVTIVAESHFHSPPAINSTLINYYIAEIDRYLPLMVNVWLVGALLFLFRLGSNFSAVNSLRKSAKKEISDPWTRFTTEQKRKLKISRDIKLLYSSAIQCPITFGSLKPIILIPVSLIFHLSPAQLEAIITHELAHIKRNDYLHNLIQSFMEAIFFYHPCFWWINSYIREQRENACDDLAIQIGIAPKDLATGLAEVLNHTQEPSPEIAMAAIRKHHPTLSRIKRMLGFKNQKPKFPSLISYTMIFTILISASLILGASHVSALEKDKSLKTQSHFTQNIPWKMPHLQNMDTVPHQKKIYIIRPEEHGEEGMTDAEPALTNKFIIIKGDTQRMLLPSKPMITFLNDSILANFPRIKMDSLMISKFRNIEFDSALHRKFRTYRFDTAILEKDIIRKLERNAKEMEKHSKELEERIQVWTERNQPRLEELQQRLKEKELIFIDSQEKFKNEIEPHLKELEKKMDDWQKEFAPKMEEFQRKMEIWQKENSKQLEELHKAIQENVKKGDS